MGHSEKCPVSVMLTSKDMKRSMAFYKDVLGFAVEACWPDEAKPMWANMMLGQQSVMLGASMTPEQAGDMCGGDSGAAAYMKTLAEEFKSNKAGVGIVTYLKVDDVDAYHAKVSKGVPNCGKPTSQFYGIRDFGVQDPDGYRFLFYTTIKMSTCQSCGMPLKDAKAGEMYCGYCTDASGKLKSYREVFEGTVNGYFMAMQKMPRPQAETAAKEHLAKMPAWKGH